MSRRGSRVFRGGTLADIIESPREHRKVKHVNEGTGEEGCQLCGAQLSPRVGCEFDKFCADCAEATVSGRATLDALLGVGLICDDHRAYLWDDNTMMAECDQSPATIDAAYSDADRLGYKVEQWRPYSCPVCGLAWGFAETAEWCCSPKKDFAFDSLPAELQAQLERLVVDMVVPFGLAVEAAGLGQGMSQLTGINSPQFKPLADKLAARYGADWRNVVNYLRKDKPWRRRYVKRSPRLGPWRRLISA